jgi:membrane dipeptidase
MIEALYPFGLTPAQEARASRLHQESVIIDFLFQGPIGTYSFTEQAAALEAAAAQRAPQEGTARLEALQALIQEEYTAGSLAELYKACWYESGITAGNRQLDVTDREALYASALDVAWEFDQKPWLVKALGAADIEAAHAQGQKAGIITCQETLGFGKDLALLERVVRFGLRAVQLTYNNQNLVGAGCMEEQDGGLSEFGKKFVAKLDALGVLVDTGHCGRRTTLDACRYSQRPVIASHTGAEAVYPHRRAKSDQEITAIAGTGGVVGIFAMPWFIAPDPAATTVEHFLDHIGHVVKVAGVDHVGIGTDWPMPQTRWAAVEFKRLLAPAMGFAPGDGPSEEYVHGLKDYRSFPNITRGLVARGYGDADIQKILGGNWLRVFRAVCG